MTAGDVVFVVYRTPDAGETDVVHVCASEAGANLRVREHERLDAQVGSLIAAREAFTKGWVAENPRPASKDESFDARRAWLAAHREALTVFMRVSGTTEDDYDTRSNGPGATYVVTPETVVD